MRSPTVSLVALLIAVAPAHAWNAIGHKMTAEIAFNQFSPERQQRITAVLRAHPRFEQDFTAAMPDEVAGGSETEQAIWMIRRASIWPDLVPHVSESVRRRYHRGTWHYVNLPIYLTEHDAASLDGQLDHNMSLQFEPPLQQNLNVVQALQGNLAVWQDQSAANADKAVALCWILHLTGDLHQPLHTVALFSRGHFPAGDRGGNDIRIDRSPRPTNLHAVWDSLPNEFADLTPSASTLATLADDVVTIDSPAAWLLRHYELALEFAYTPGLKADLQVGLAKGAAAAMTLNEAYRSRAGAIAKEQVIMAGHRIAALLE